MESLSSLSEHLHSAPKGIWSSFSEVIAFESHQIIYVDFSVNTHPRTMLSFPQELRQGLAAAHIRVLHVFLRFVGYIRE